MIALAVDIIVTNVPFIAQLSHNIFLDFNPEVAEVHQLFI
ncbi:hypothetical protein DSUL_50387 [Desulfovibrionales bacterium]